MANGKFETDAARRLVLEHGREKALKLAVNNRMKARRARSRKQFQLWVAISAEIEHSGSPSEMNKSSNPQLS